MVVSHVVRLIAEHPQIGKFIIPIVPIFMVNHVLRLQIEMLSRNLAGDALTLAIGYIFTWLILPDRVIASPGAEYSALKAAGRANHSLAAHTT
jgi:hypothetical protein